MTLPHLQLHAAAMQAIGRPNPDQSHPFVITMRLRQLDDTFWGNEWGELAPAVYWRWERCRAGLLGMLVVGEEVK